MFDPDDYSNAVSMITRQGLLLLNNLPPLPSVSVPQAAFEVTTLDDTVDASDGLLSLREAIELANTQSGLDTIVFAEAIRGGTIELTGILPTITDDATIDGDPGNGGASGITINGAYQVDLGPVGSIKSGARIVLETSGVAVALKDLTITAGETGIRADGSALQLDRVAVVNNVQQDPLGGAGIGIDLANGSLILADSSVSGNGGEDGAGIRFANSDIEVARSTVASNGGSLTFGHGLLGSGTLSVTNSTIADNRAFFGIDIDGELTLINSTVTGNGDPDGYSGTADIFGGVTVAGTALILNGTLTGNDGYAVVLSDAATIVELQNSIVDGAVAGTVASNGANVFTAAMVNGAVAGDVTGASTSDLFATGDLADNGGPTETVALLDDPANPALDAADPADAPPLDQRGFPRDATPDIGSFELQVQPPPNTLPPLAEKVPLPDSEIYGAPLLLVGPSGDAEIRFVDEVAAFQSSLGVYLVGPDGTIGATEWVFDRIEHSEASDLASEGARPGGGPLSPGDAVLLSDLFAPEELAPGTGFGLFLVADGWALNPSAIFDDGSLEFRSNGASASVTDTTPELVFIAENGSETLVLGDIMHSIDAGSANPLSYKLNPGDTGQVTSGLLDASFTVAFEDKPLNENSDRDFNDALFAVDSLQAEDAGLVSAAASAGNAFVSTAQVEQLVVAAGDIV